MELTGAVKETWSDDAFVITENRSGPVQYKSGKGKVSLTLLAGEGSGDDERPALAVVSAKGQNYTAQPGDEDAVEVDPDGAGAEVDATASGMGGGKDIHIVATFTC